MHEALTVAGAKLLGASTSVHAPVDGLDEWQVGMR